MLLDEGLRELADWLDRGEVQQMLADKIVQVAGEEYPKLVGALGFIGLNAEELGNKFAAGLVRGANTWLHDISSDPEHERRKAFDRGGGRVRRAAEVRSGVQGAHRRAQAAMARAA